MTRIVSPKRFGSCVLGIAMTVGLLHTAAPVGLASDHADPIFNRQLTAGITGLFVFPTKNRERVNDNNEPIQKGDALAFILCTRRALDRSPPFNDLEDLTFRIHIDLGQTAGDAEERALVNLMNMSDLARYGGTVKRPEKIQSDVTFTFQLNEDLQFANKTIQGKRFRGPSLVTWHAGIHDDPFIFPQFFRTNVIAVVLHVPLECFPKGQTDWLIWATSSKGGKQIDHVGRSQRTQLPRFDFLNKLHPRDHVREIRKRKDSPGVVQDFAATKLQTEFAIRPYDIHPDVMIFTTRRKAGFPNGRLLTDDVAKLTCESGDCQLFELSFAHKRSGEQGGMRPTKNDKCFLRGFPYLADKWENPMPTPTPQLTTNSWVIVGVLVVLGLVLLLIFLVLPWWLYWRTFREKQKLARRLEDAKQTQTKSPTVETTDTATVA